MFVNTSKLPHLLASRDYSDPHVYQQELSSKLRHAWHVVGSTLELAKHGDFMTRWIAGIPVQIRNFHGELRALSNICAHRHAEICSLNFGNSPTMRCQYHGWEYQADGNTGRIPEPKNFVPIDRAATCLPRYALETVGQLVFVNVASQPNSLMNFLGCDFHQLLLERFSANWILALNWQPGYQVNWKIPIENSLEAYHVPSVHPRTFRDDPGAERSTHEILAHRTSLQTSLPFSPHTRLDAAFQRLEGGFVRWLGIAPTGIYQQHHVFPNLLFSFTDAISLVNCVHPLGPQQCLAIVRQFGRLPQSNGFVRRAVAKLWSRLTAAITKKVLHEDMQIFAAIQRGLNHSPHAGVLGICEERIHCFQNYIKCQHQ